MFDVPPLESGATFDARLRLSGPAGLTGPASAETTASLRLFATPFSGTLSGTALERGNHGGDLLPTKGSFMCDVVLKPIVHRFQLPPTVEELDFGLSGAMSAALPTADSGVVKLPTADSGAMSAALPTADGGAVKLPTADSGGAPLAKTDSVASGVALVPTAGSGASWVVPLTEEERGGSGVGGVGGLADGDGVDAAPMQS